MNYYNLIYGILTILIVGGVIMKIFHLPYAHIGEIVFYFSLTISFLLDAIEKYKLRKRIKELEK